ncbi:methyltransferase domain-containing protein [Nostoc sp. PA-18-2419]|uniref:methyltransferase domain-containing protein n=1 Tax=Nostoc sp. PA-18-2419 TaxID=2575443 RepID=UPI0011083861|nr:methyltransferase domain-containing protein [Nostoc sp. PA-18-2419]
MERFENQALDSKNMNEALKDTICLQCGNKLGNYQNFSNKIICSNCAYEYPVIEQKIPILLKNPHKYLAEILSEYEKYIQESENRLQEIVVSDNKNPLRSQVIKSIESGIIFNNQYIQLLREQISKHIELNHLMKIATHEKSYGYSANFSYLQRDWCWLPEGEEELELIQNTLLKYILSFDTERDAAIVLGAGTGRIAWDLRDKYKWMYATDLSYTMAALFYDLLEKEIVFYEINQKNIFNDTEAARCLTATMYPPKKEVVQIQQPSSENFSYFIGDALHLPFVEHSLSTVISVYFTDVVPPQFLFAEIARVIKLNGIFIHFGPLAYHFNDLSYSLAANEIRALLKQHNFEILAEETVPTFHKSSSVSMSSKLYRNWTFAAIWSGFS